MKPLFLSLLAVLLIASDSIRCAYMPSDPKTRLDPARVLVMYDATYTGDEDLNGVQDSLQLAQFYAQARSIPEGNLLPITWTDSGDYTFEEFKSTWLGPLVQHLDSIGPTTIDVFAILWPLPSMYIGGNNNRVVSVDSTLLQPYSYYTGSLQINNQFGWNNPYYFPNPKFATDIARFSHTGDWVDSYLVSRIDGPGGLMQKYNMIANSIYADKYVNTDAFFGNAYVDTRGHSTSTNLEDYAAFTDVSTGYAGTLASTDFGIVYGASYFADRGLPYKWENTDQLIGSAGLTFQDGSSASEAPRPMFYFGWYSVDKYYDIYEWLPGSYASDLNSLNFNYDFRQNKYPVFGTQSLYNGATTAMGCIFEPYTAGHPRVAVPAYMLLQGYSWAEAATAATPYLAWNSIGFGDPLYQPFAAKELVVDTDAPQPGPVSISYNNRTGASVVFSLQGIESAKMKLWYGIISTRENVVESRHYQTHFRQAFPQLRGSTTYKYKFELEDPAGNKFVSEEYSFTTIAQEPYYGNPQHVPSEIYCYTFDYGGEGIATHDLVGNGYSYERTDSGLQVATFDENYIFDTFNSEWMKWTIHANFTGRYLFEVKHKATVDNTKMAILTYVDGIQVLDPYTVVPADNVFVTLGNFILAEGDHVIMIKMDQTTGTFPLTFENGAGQFRRIKLTLTEHLSDNTAPVISVLSSMSDDQSFIEEVSFTDDIGVSHVDVQFNGQAVSSTIKELNSDGTFKFYFGKQSTYNVTITAYDFAARSSSHYIFYQSPPDSLPPSVIITPDGSLVTPDGSIFTPDGTILAPDGTVIPQSPKTAFSSASIVTSTALLVIGSLFSVVF